MKGCLVRVGIDQTCGGFNSPVDIDSGDYLYIPIPQGETECRAGLETPYGTVRPYLEAWNARHGTTVSLPEELFSGNMHLDPDFESLTYGDQRTGRGVNLSKLDKGDFLAFYASFRDINENKLIYAIFGIYFIKELLSVSDIKKINDEMIFSSNAHLRLLSPRESDIIFFAEDQRSGRFSKIIPIGGKSNDGFYRVEQDILEEWGGINVKDGYIQRSVNPPFFTDAEKFIYWLYKKLEQNNVLVLKNNWNV